MYKNPLRINGFQKPGNLAVGTTISHNHSSQLPLELNLQKSSQMHLDSKVDVSCLNNTDKRE
jgi:hypothetical protein